MPKDELARLIKELEKQMKQAAKDPEFEKAAMLRDQVFELRQQMEEGDEKKKPAWVRLRDLPSDAPVSELVGEN